MSTELVPAHLMTPHQIAEVDRLIREGSTRKRALAAAGVSEATYRAIRRISRDGDHPHGELYASFLRGLDKAEAGAESALVKTIGASRDWRAAAFLLERRWPEQWAQRIQIEVKREVEHILDVAERTIPQEQFERLLEALSDSSAGQALAPAEQIIEAKLH